MLVVAIDDFGVCLVILSCVILNELLVTVFKGLREERPLKSKFCYFEIWFQLKKQKKREPSRYYSEETLPNTENYISDYRFQVITIMLPPPLLLSSVPVFFAAF